MCRVAAIAVLMVTGSVYAQGNYEGQIIGAFHGWDGDTVYELMDGRMIKESENHHHYHYAYAPRVIIYQSNSGGYKIHVQDDDDKDVGIVVLR